MADEELPRIVENFHTESKEPEPTPVIVPVKSYSTEDGILFELYQGGRVLNRTIQIRRES